MNLPEHGTMTAAAALAVATLWEYLHGLGIMSMIEDSIALL